MILTEKIINKKPKEQHYALSDDISDIQRMLSFDKTPGCEYVYYKAYSSGIVLFDGKATKVEEGLRNTNGVSNLGERQFNLELNEKSNGYRTIMHKTALDNLNYRVIFSGKIAEIDEDIFAIPLMSSGLKNLEMCQNIKFPQISYSIINLEKVLGSNQKFGNSTFELITFFRL